MLKLRKLGVALLFLPQMAIAQNVLQGEVSFLTSQNVYVKFSGTKGIAMNDTLFLIQDDTISPCLVVNSLSSTSCVCKVVNGCTINIGDKIQAPIGTSQVTEPLDRSAKRSEGILLDRSDALPESAERFRGRISAASYSTMPSGRDNDLRMMYRFSLDADNISNSKFSAETYLNYRQLYPANLDTRPQRTQYFNVYNLAVSYAPDSNTVLTLGRKINNSASSLGAIDGFQAERRFGGFFAGAILGFRPDIQTYGLNTDLLEYGGYLGSQVSSGPVISRATIGLLQQTDRGSVDRRYAFMQSSTTIKGNLNLFSSAELDLYSTVGAGVRLTNLFISARYRIGRKVDLFASYDNRRRVIYYETYQSDVEQLLDDDLARQGARVRVNVRATKAISFSAGYSNRFQADGANASDNIQLAMNLNKDPDGLGRWSIMGNRNTSNYLRSDVLTFRHSRTLIPKRLTMSLYFRTVDYLYANRPEGSSLTSRVSQNYYGTDLTLTFARTLTFTVLGELATISEDRNYRLNMSLTKRFDSKRKR